MYWKLHCTVFRAAAPCARSWEIPSLGINTEQSKLFLQMSQSSLQTCPKKWFTYKTILNAFKYLFISLVITVTESDVSRNKTCLNLRNGLMGDDHALFLQGGMLLTYCSVYHLHPENDTLVLVRQDASPPLPHQS